MNLRLEVVSLPHNVGQLQQLKSLTLALPNVEHLPDSISDISSLEELSLKECTRLENLPRELGKLTALKILTSEMNPNLRALPASLEGLKSLKILNLCGCGIPELPPSITELKDNLEVLSLTFLPWNEVPEVIGELTALKALHFCYFPRVILPESFTKLTALQVLEFSCCGVSAVSLPVKSMLERIQCLVLDDDNSLEVYESDDDEDDGSDGYASE